MPFVKSIAIDKESRFTPKRVIWRKNEFTSIHTDHFSIDVVLSDMPRRKTVSVKSSTWNLGKPDGWKVYEELTDKAADKIEAIVLGDNVNIDVAMKKISVIDNEIKFASFGKTRSKRTQGREGKQ